MGKTNQNKKPTFGPISQLRRKFLGAMGYSTVTGLPGISGLILGACSSGSTNSSFNGQPISQPVITSRTASLNIQGRSAQLSDVPAPNDVNSWVYCTEGLPDGVPLTTFLGPTFEQRKGFACGVKVTNRLPANGKYLSVPPGVTPSANQICGQVTLQSDVGVVMHLHGGRVQGYQSSSGLQSDGWPLEPMSWPSNPYGFSQQKLYVYRNEQRATMLWYHDHAMDNNGAHVYAGLAGLYIIRDSNDDSLVSLVGGAANEKIFVIQDRIYNSSLQYFDYNAGTPNNGSYSRPEFLGNTLIVNGRPATTTALTPNLYRLRLLNGCNSRTIAIALVDMNAIATGSGRVWYTDLIQVVGGDGGLTAQPHHLDARGALVIAPSQRRDLLVDCSSLPSGVTNLRLVNVSLAYYLSSNATTPEAIYTTYTQSVLTPTSVNYTSSDNILYGVLGNPLAVITNFSINQSSGEQPVGLNQVAVNNLLSSSATDDDFKWNNIPYPGARLIANSGVNYGPNRLILLMSNTNGYSPTANPGDTEGYPGWSDVQIFELTAGGGNGLQWNLPLNVNLTTGTNPPPGAPSSVQVPYTLSRSTFFTSANVPDIAVANKYPDLHDPTIQPQSGTYERWYVANVGNPQPLVASGPDMHPFHVHLVNFVVVRRWNLTSDGRFELAQADPMDGIARQDTVILQSDTLCEILVYFPPGYNGDYVYHCHLLEHEDKCMMSSFRVT